MEGEQEAKQKRKRTPWSIVKSVFSWAVTAVALFMMVFTIVSVLTFDRNDRNIFGFKAFIVLSDSMKATDFAAGDLVLCRNVDPATLEPGDIITFQSIDKDHYGEIITHKIRRRTTDEDGLPAFITYGTTTNTDDNTPVGYSFVLGKYKFHIPKVGRFFQFLKTTPGYIVCILIPFLILIIMQGANSVKLFRQYRREQVEALAAEREKIEREREDARRQMEQERAQSAAMMQELLQLKAQMSAQAASPPGSSPQGGGVTSPQVGAQNDSPPAASPQADGGASPTASPSPQLAENVSPPSDTPVEGTSLPLDDTSADDTPPPGDLSAEDTPPPPDAPPADGAPPPASGA